MTAPRRFAIVWLIVGALAAADLLLTLALLALGVSWWPWPVAAAVVFHVIWLALAWWRFW